MILNPKKLIKMYLLKRYYRRIPNNRLPRLLIIANMRHGKDTVADILKTYGFNCLASSTFATEKIMIPYFESQGNHYNSPEECFEDRVNHRACWYDEIEKYNEPTWDRITREMIRDGYNVYVGMRSQKEFTSSRKHYNFVIWVDASKRLPPEDKSSNTMDITNADIVIDNNGTLDDLQWNVYLAMSVIRRLYW